MNIIIIAKKEIVSAFRDRRTLLLMLAFPIVLIMILGTALTNVFDDEVSVGDIHVLYKDQSDGEFSQGFKAFTKGAKTSGVHFEKVLSGMDGKQEVEQGHYDAYLEIAGSSGIMLYQMEKNSVKNSMIQGMLTAFANRYNAVAEIIKVSPKQAGEAFANSSRDDYIKETSLNSDKHPGSMDYYAVTMTTLIALYGALHASYLIRGERLGKTADRLIAAPVHKAEIFAGKLIGGLAVNLICILIVVAVSKFLFKANWGEHFGLVLAVLFSVVLFAVSLGLGVSYLTKTGEAAVAVINVLIPLVAFVGGAYFPINDAAAVFAFIKDLSPLTWTNEAIIKIIYTNDLAAGWPAISLNMGLSVLFLLIVVVSLRRREGL